MTTRTIRILLKSSLYQYDNEDTFNLAVLLAYKDELLEKHLTSVVYTINDALQSLIFWRGQVRICSIWFPLHSFILFCVAIILVERPYMLPAVLPLCIGWFMLASMYWRLQEPSPWQRCLTFGHYFRILILGHSSPEAEEIRAWEGHEESEAKKKAIQRRIEDDRAFMKEKEAVEEKIKSFERKQSMETQVQSVLDIELLNVLGKIQGIVGGEKRNCLSRECIRNDN